MPARGHQTPGLPVKGTKVQMPGPGALPCLTEGAPLAASPTQERHLFLIPVKVPYVLMGLCLFAQRLRHLLGQRSGLARQIYTDSQVPRGGKPKGLLPRRFTRGEM